MHFIFENESKTQAAYRVEVPVGIKSKEALLESLSVALRFPDYFGGNWDALDECMRDLSWLPKGDVILHHRDLPMPKDRTGLSTYLTILKDAVEKSNLVGERRLFVTFPASTEDMMREILEQDCEIN